MKQNHPPKYWLPLKEPQTTIRTALFCLPFAGGNANFFKPWAEKLPADIALYALQLPGRGQYFSLPKVNTMHTLIDLILEETRSLISGDYISGNYLFLGHSMGAAIAYELCWRFQEEGFPLPKHFICSGCLPAQLKRQAPWVHLMSLQETIRELKILGGTSEEILNNKELLQICLPTIRADFELIEKYQCYRKEKLDINTSIWAGMHDPRVPRDLIHRWQERLSSPSEIVEFDGTHMFIDMSQCGEACLAELGKVLATTKVVEAKFDQIDIPTLPSSENTPSNKTEKQRAPVA